MTSAASKDLNQKVHSVRHTPETNARALNQAVEKANKERQFISRAVKQLDGLMFPAYKYQIIDHLKSNSGSNEILNLFRTLNGTLLFRDQYQLKKALEENNSEAKKENQISDETRTNLQVKKVNPHHKRKDYTEVQATATKNYICDFCGKSFLARDDLIHHQQFESGKNQ